jgi:hypothetical protein
MDPMTKADSTHTTSDTRLEQLEAPICAAIDMAALCILAFDHISGETIPDGTFVRVDRRYWHSLGFALLHQQELAKAVLVAFEASVDGAL